MELLQVKVVRLDKEQMLQIHHHILIPMIMVPEVAVDGTVEEVHAYMVVPQAVQVI